jgi:DNA-binding CsgD family transcriptional regulator
MTDTADGNATALAAGRLSLDYLNSVLSDCAGLDGLYAITSQMQWATFDSGSGLEQVAAAVSLIASAYAAYRTEPAAVDRKGAGAARRASKNPLAATQPDELSGREKACLSWAAAGKSSWEIGRILAISENTVIFHIKNAMRKLGANSRTLAAFKAVELGLIEPAVEPAPPAVRRATGV